jgi:hypothetical protein
MKQCKGIDLDVASKETPKTIDLGVEKLETPITRLLNKYAIVCPKCIYSFSTPECKAFADEDRDECHCKENKISNWVLIDILEREIRETEGVSKQFLAERFDEKIYQITQTKYDNFTKEAILFALKDLKKEVLG